MAKSIDLIGFTSGYITIIGRAERGDTPRKRREKRWICLCICGKKTTHYGQCIKLGKVISCGCKKKEVLSQLFTKHGCRKNRTSEYNIWASLLQRCENKKNHAYDSYGGRGIKVYKAWKQFGNFLKDMGVRPSKKHSIERINNDGNYEPSNCKWATKTEQANNRKSNIFYEYNGEKHSIAEWARIYNINHATLLYRYNKGLRGDDLFYQGLYSTNGKR